MKTHVVIDLILNDDEGGDVILAGTIDECYNFLKGQWFGYEVRPMTEEELKIHNADEKK